MTSQDTTPPGAQAEALQGLRSAAQALSVHLVSAAQRADLAVIEDAIARLARSTSDRPEGLEDFDPTRLSHLMDLTGPDLAQELLVRLGEDLSGTLTALEEGAAASDWKRLREGTHVLISLAGSVGALSLQARAEALNATAHAQDEAATRTQMPPILRELRALMTHVQATQTGSRQHK